MHPESLETSLITNLSKRPLSLRLKGDEILRKRCESVNSFTTELDVFLNEMLTFMRVHGGIGLAAPQIGIGLRTIVAEMNGHAIVLANPEIVSASDNLEIMEEGCLSIPNDRYEVERPLFIEVKARTASGGRLHFEADGLFARVLQHEIDHLDGVLICDKNGGNKC